MRATPRPSLYQQRILEFVRAGVGHGVVRATAGSGKTTTLVQVASSLLHDLCVCFLAFARDAATELRSRLPGRVEARTVHSLGRRVLQTHLGRLGVKLQAPDETKYRLLVKAEMSDVALGYALPQEELDAAGSYLLELVKFARFNLTQTKDETAVRDLAVRCNLTPPEDTSLELELHRRLPQVLRQGYDQGIRNGLIDYTDMLYLPWVLKLKPDPYDFVCIDEAQDYSALALEPFQHSVVTRSMRQNWKECSILDLDRIEPVPYMVLAPQLTHQSNRHQLCVAAFLVPCYG